MHDRDPHELLRLSVEASPEAPVDPAPGQPPPPEAPTTRPPDQADRQSTMPVSALSAPGDARAMTAGLKAKANPAEWTFERLCRMIEDFESRLSAEEEVGATIVGAPGEGTFHVDDIGFWGPDLIMFYGKNMYGRSVRLIQHYQQLSVLLSALPRQKEQEPARRIGFALRNRMEEAAATDAPPPPAPIAAPGTIVPPQIAKRPRGGERP